MPRSYWHVVLAVFGVLTVAAIFALALQPEQPKLSGNTAYQEQEPAYRAGGYDCQPSVVGGLTDRERLRRTVACQDAEEQHRLQSNDLIQQRRAADAAEASAVFAFQQTRVAAWGLALGIVTMFAAIAAAWFARSAANVGQSTYDAFIMVERSRLVVSINGIRQVNGNQPQAEMLVTNIGKAACVVTGIYWALQKTERFDETTLLTGPPRSEFVNGSAASSLGFIIRGETAEHEFLRGEVVYTSPIGKDHRSFFCFRLMKAGKEQDAPYTYVGRRGKDWPADT